MTTFTQNHPHDPIATSEEGRGVTALDGTTKAKIERAALHLFQQQSVDNVTTKAIAAAAGISEGALYRHFKSKDDIGAEIFTAIHSRLGDLMDAALLSADTIDDQVAALVAAYCQTADDDWSLFSFHLLNMHRYLPSMEANGTMINNPVDSAEKMIAAAIENSQLKKTDTCLLASMCMGIVLQPALHKVYGRLHGNLSQHAPDLTKSIRALLTSYSK